jgi:hypothetical protein
VQRLAGRDQRLGVGEYQTQPAERSPAVEQAAPAAVFGVFRGAGEACGGLRRIERRPIGDRDHDVARPLTATGERVRPQAGHGLDQLEAHPIGVADRLPVRVLAPVRGPPGAVRQAPVVDAKETRVLGGGGAAIARQHADPGDGGDG